MESLNNFEALRKEAIESIVNFSQINELPNTIINKDEKIKSTFINEEIIIKKLDYYYTNSISRASKTMSECRQINNQTLKTGTNN